MTRSGTGKTKINIYFSERILEAIRIIAAHRGTTYSEMIRQACHEYVIREGGKAVVENQEIRKVVR